MRQIHRSISMMKKEEIFNQPLKRTNLIEDLTSTDDDCIKPFHEEKRK